MTSPNVTLLRDLVMIKASELSLSKSDGGIIIPGEIDKVAPKRATVIATGPGTYNKKGDFVKNPVEPGDEILYTQTNVIGTKIDGKEYLLIPASEVLLKLESSSPKLEAVSSLTAEEVVSRLVAKFSSLGLVRLEDMTAPVTLFKEANVDNPNEIPLMARSFIVTEESLNEPFVPPDGTVAFSMWQVVDRVPGVRTGEFVARLAFSDRSDLKRAE